MHLERASAEPRQASNSSRIDACSCSCCVAQPRACVPGAACRLCAPGALSAAFAALQDEVDYSRFCFSYCQPGQGKACRPRGPRKPSATTALLAAPSEEAEALAEAALLKAQRHAREAGDLLFSGRKGGIL